MQTRSPGKTREANQLKLHAMQKYAFRIETKTGQKVDNLVIHGTDQAHAESKLRQMYLRCQILEAKVIDDVPRGEGTDLESAISLIAAKEDSK